MNEQDYLELGKLRAATRVLEIDVRDLRVQLSDLAIERDWLEVLKAHESTLRSEIARREAEGEEAAR